MNEFDDPGMGRALQHLGGPPPDVDAAFATFQHKVRVARRRRAAAWMGSVGAVAVLFVAAAAALPRNSGPSRVLPAASTSPEPGETDRPDATDETTEVTESPEPTEATQPEASDNAPDDSSPVDVIAGNDGQGSNGDHGGTTVPGGSPTGHGGSSTTSTTSTTSTSTTTTTTKPVVPPPPPPADLTQTCSSPGGSIDVKVSGGVFSLVTVSPAAGFAQGDTETEPDQIKVQFQGSGDVQYEASARWQDNAITCDSSHD